MTRDRDLEQHCPRVLLNSPAQDTDDTGALDVTDAVYLLRHLFQGTAAPAPPYPEAGIDPTADGLDC
jgi:hypothetical protein